VNCKNQEYTGVHHDGGYAEMMFAKASGLASIPDNLASAEVSMHIRAVREAKPIKCDGIQENRSLVSIISETALTQLIELNPLTPLKNANSCVIQ